MKSASLISLVLALGVSTSTAATPIPGQQEYSDLQALFNGCLGEDQGLAKMSFYSNGFAVVEPTTNRAFDFTGADAVVKDCWYLNQGDIALALAHDSSYGNWGSLRSNDLGPAMFPGVQPVRFLGEGNLTGKDGLQVAASKDQKCSSPFQEATIDHPGCHPFPEVAGLVQFKYFNPEVPAVNVTLCLDAHCRSLVVTYSFTNGKLACLWQPIQLVLVSPIPIKH